MNPVPAPVASPGIRWSAVAAGAGVAWALAWARGWLVPLVAAHAASAVGSEGLKQASALVVGLVGGAVAGHLAKRQAALHGALALAVQVVLAFGMVLAGRAAHGYVGLAGFGGSNLLHGAWIVFLGYLGGLLVASRTGERVVATASVDWRAVLLGAAVAIGILSGFGIGSGVMWNVGQIIIGPVLLFAGAASGALAARSGGRHGALAGALASSAMLIMSTVSLARWMPRLLEMPGYWVKTLASCGIAIAAGAIGGLVAAKVMERSRA
jgi:hypothetical protein